MKKIFAFFASMLFGASSIVSAEGGANVLDLTVKDIQGNDVSLSEYKGKVLLIVNVASKCGLTPQYEDLVAIYNKYHDQGFEILGFPANNFAGQEPGTNAEIATFCSTNYKVEFDMFSKISVAGEDQAPLYTLLTSEKSNKPFAGEIKWNFTKFLVNKEGQVIARFEPRTKPTDESVLKAIEEALATE